MLRVRTYIDKSGIHGIGLFANQDIPKGTITWQYDPKFDMTYSLEEINMFPEEVRDFLFYYTYYDKEQDQYVLCSDNQRFINHGTKKANIVSTPNQDIASRDIRLGEELVCDYNQFDNGYFQRMGIVTENLVD